MNKVCNKCGIDKSLEDFSFRNKAKGVRRGECKSCVADMDSKNYRTNPNRRSSIRERVKKYKEINRKYIVEYLKSHPCVDCGEDDIIVLDFDHVRGTKKYNIADKISTMSLPSLMAEIDKCDVRCANCHRRVTAKRLPRHYKLAGVAEMD